MENEFLPRYVNVGQLCVRSDSNHPPPAHAMLEALSGSTQEADDYVALLRKTIANLNNCSEPKTLPGITLPLSDFKAFFVVQGDYDTRDVLTSPAAAKALAALETAANLEDVGDYVSDPNREAPRELRHKSGRIMPVTATHAFWKRVEAVFHFIDGKGNGDGKISRDEFVQHFKGNTVSDVCGLLKVLL